MPTLKSLLFISITIISTVYAQLVIKWQVIHTPLSMDVNYSNILKLLKFCINPWILSAYLAVFFGGLAWFAALSKLDLSYAYPFMSLTFIMVSIFSNIFLSEPLSMNKIVGLILIVIGLLISSKI